MRIDEMMVTDWGKSQEWYENKTCLVVGGAPSVWNDYKRARQRCPNSHVFAVNAVGCYSPDLDYWFSLHPYRLKIWHEVRRMNYKGDAPYQKPTLFSLRHTHPDGVVQGDIDGVWQCGDPTVKRSAKHGGSLEDSGFFAMCIALAMGYSRVWLVGMPADDSGHIFIPEWQYLEHDKAAIKQAWINTIDTYPEISERVRSCSGLTQELLGDIE